MFYIIDHLASVASISEVKVKLPKLEDVPCATYYDSVYSHTGG